MLSRKKIEWVITLDEKPRKRPKPYEKELSDVKNEREDVQKKTFAKWINSQLVKSSCTPVVDLFLDLRDGNRLLALLEVLTSSTYKRERGRMRLHHLNNVNKALDILTQNNVKLVNISSDDIVDGNPKLTLGLVWSIILHWQVHNNLRHLMSELRQTNLEKTLLAWCRKTTTGYAGVDVRNFTTSWSDGAAFNAIIHKWRPALFSYDDIYRRHPNARLEHAFRIAQEHLGIERLLDPEDVNTNCPDKKSVMMYVMCLFESLPNGEMAEIDPTEVVTPVTPGPEGGFEFVSLSAPTSRPLSLATNVSLELGGYQMALEDVLTWLLEADEKLNQSEEIPAELSFAEVKELFKEHETFLLGLAAHQDGVGAVLEEGRRLLCSSHPECSLSADEEREVRAQMRLLDARWEGLRTRALDRQSAVHDRLMSVQQKQLDGLRQWLTATEDRISKMPELTNRADDLNKQIEQHQMLKVDLEEKQKEVDSLSDLVVVVDENNPENGYTDMEDQLNALNERWNHICTWTDQRFVQLQTLSNKWTALNEEYILLLHWLDQKESTLKQMEANPASEIGEVLQRIKDLQKIKREMDLQQRKLLALQDKTQDECDKDPVNDGGGLLLEKLEALQDRWDALLLIIEVQGQRITNLGFEFNINAYDQIEDDNAKKSPNDNRQTDWEMTESFAKTSSEKTKAGPKSPTKSSPKSGPKKRRHESQTQREFDSATSRMTHTFASLEHKLCSKNFKTLTLSEKIRFCNELENDFKSKQFDVLNVKQLSERLLEEMQNEPTDDVKKKMNTFNLQYNNIQSAIQDFKDLIEFDTEKDFFYTELGDLKLVLADFQDWFKTITPGNQAREYKKQLIIMTSYEDRINRLKSKLKELSTRQIASGEDAELMKNDVDNFCKGWNVIISQISTPKQAKNQDKLKKLTETLENLSEFVNSTESVLLKEHDAVGESNGMQDKLKNLQGLKKNMVNFKTDYDFVLGCAEQKSFASEDVLSKITEFKKQWSNISDLLDKRIKILNSAIENLNQFNEEVSGLKVWMNDVAVFLKEEKDIPTGDEPTLEAKLEQSNALLEDVETLQPNVSNINGTAAKLLENAENSFAEKLRSELKDLNDTWSETVENIKTHNTNLQKSLDKTKKILEDIKDTQKWLINLDLEIPSAESCTITNSAELFHVKEKYQILKEKCDLRSLDFRNLNERGNDMMLSAEKNPLTDLARKFTHLNARWTEVTAGIYERYKVLQDASHEFGVFKALVAQETDWLDKLEKRLRKSPKSAADAEEISEELDDLENYIRNHPQSRLDKIQDIGTQLMDAHIMPQIIKDEVDELTSRWNTLSQQACARTALLENSVSEAQKSESDILSLQQWLTHVDQLLTTRIKNDLTAHDLPDDNQRLLEEFETQQITLKEMAQQIEVYKSAGKHEAAYRLQEQMNLLQARFDEVQAKFMQFRSAGSALETRLTRALRELNSVNDAICLLELSSEEPEAIEGQLKHCLRFYRTLSDIKSEVENVIKSGRKLVEDKAVPNPQKFTTRIDTLKELYNKLGEQITKSKLILESTLKLSKELQKNHDNLNDWLNDIENEGKTDFEREIPEMKDLKERLNEGYIEFQKHCEPIYLENVRERINLTNLRWDKIIGNEENAEKSGEIMKFLNELEQTLTNVDLLSVERLQGMEQQLMSKKSEVDELNYRPLVMRWQSLLDQIKGHLAKKTNSDDKIVIVSDTVRRRLVESVPDIVECATNGNKIGAKNKQTKDSDDTFNLAKQSSLFEQISDDTLRAGPEKDFVTDESHKCKVVEVKEREILKSSVTSEVLSPSTSTSHKPQHVIVETVPEDTDTDTDDTKNGDGLSPWAQGLIKTLDDDKKGEPIGLLKRRLDGVLITEPKVKKSMKIRMVDDWSKEDLPTPPPTPVDVCVEMTDKVKRADQTTIKTWKDPDLVSEYMILDEVDPNKVTLRKEVELSKTYRLVGNVKSDPMRSKSGTSIGGSAASRIGRKSLPSSSMEPEECDSFYGSDKETDDIVVFSEDEDIAAGPSQDDFSSSDDDVVLGRLIERKLYESRILADEPENKPSPKKIESIQLESPDTSSTSIEHYDLGSPQKTDEIKFKTTSTSAKGTPNQDFVDKSPHKIVEAVVPSEDDLFKKCSPKPKLQSPTRDEQTRFDFSSEPEQNAPHSKVTVVAVSPKTTSVSIGTTTSKIPKSPSLAHRSPKSPKASSKIPKSPSLASKIPKSTHSSSNTSASPKPPRKAENLQLSSDVYAKSPKSPVAKFSNQQQPASKSHEAQLDTDLYAKPLKSSISKPTNQVLDTEISYERTARAMLKRMDGVSMTLRGLEGLKDPSARLEVLKNEIGSLASDAASLISRGDGLVLTAEPGVAERLKVECQDRLREKWARVMSEAEVRKSQTLQAEENLFNYNRILFDLSQFLSTISERIDQANNHDAASKALRTEFSSKFGDLKKLNGLATELKIRRIGYDDKTRLEVNEKWTQVASKCRLLGDSNDKKNLDEFALGSDKSFQSQQVDPHDFISRASKTSEVVLGVLKQLDSPPLSGKDFEEIEDQAASLMIIKRAIEDLQPLMEEIEYDREQLRTGSNRENYDQVRSVTRKLREEWQTLNTRYEAKNKKYAKCQEVWSKLHDDCAELGNWLDGAETVFEGCGGSESSGLRELERQVKSRHRVVGSLSAVCRDVIRRAGPDEAQKVEEMLDQVKQRWQALLAGMSMSSDHKRSPRASEFNPTVASSPLVSKGSGVDLDISSIRESLAQGRALFAAPPANPSDDTALAVRLSALKTRLEDLKSKINEMDKLKQTSKPLPISADSFDQLLSDLEKTTTDLSTQRQQSMQALSSLQRHSAQLDAAKAWVSELRTRINISRGLPDPKDRERVIDGIMVSARERSGLVTDALGNFANLERQSGLQQANSGKPMGDPICPELREKVESLRKDWAWVLARGEPTATSEEGDKGLACFATAHAGVLYDYEHDTMQLIQGHQNKITSLSCDAQGRWIVSACVGEESVVVVWDATKLIPIRSIYEPHPKRGVAVASISPDGKYLVTVGDDPTPACRLWLWTFGREESDGRAVVGGTGMPVYITFDPNNTRHFIICSTTSVAFGIWERDDESVCELRSSFTSESSQTLGAQAEEGRVLKIVQPPPFWKSFQGTITDGCYIQDTRWCLTATSEGYVHVWSDDILDTRIPYSNKKACIKIIKLQKCGIGCVNCVDGVIITGDFRGRIRFYDKYLRILYWCQDFDLDGIFSMKFNLESRKYVIKDPTDFTDVEGWNLRKMRKSYMHCCDDVKCCHIPAQGLCTDMPDIEDRSEPSEILYDTTVPRDASILRKPFIVRDFIVGTMSGRIGIVKFLENRCDFFLNAQTAPVTAIELHPESHLLIVGTSLGTLSLYNYTAHSCLLEVKLPLVPMPDKPKESDPSAPVAVTYIKYSTLGTHLACGMGNGTIWFLNPSLLIPLSEKPESHPQDDVTEIVFSSDDSCMAASDKYFSICVFKRDSASSNGYKFFGNFRSHYAPIVKILFGYPRPDYNHPRLLSIGQDRMMIEYDLSGDTLALKSGERIEQSAIPTAACWYLRGDDNLIITYEDQCKYKIIDDGTGMTMGTYLGPTYGSPIRHIEMLPDAELLTDSPQRIYKHFVFATDIHIGLQTLPPDGNPYKSVGMVGHPNKISAIRVSYDGLHLFTAGENDTAVLMWRINPRSADLMSKLGGTGLEPYLALLEGGEDGWIYREMQDMFYYSQILHQGENTDEPRRVSHIIPLSELPDLMRAVGVYPSEYEVENLTTEVVYQNRLAAKMGEKCNEEEVSFEQFVRLYVNHRSVNGIPLEKIRKAFAVLSRNSDQEMAMERIDFLEGLCNKGEAPGKELMKQYLMELTGTKPTKATEESEEPDDNGSIATEDSYFDLFGGKEQYLDFSFIPPVLTCDHFIDNILGIETNPEKIKSFTEAIQAHQYSEPVLVDDEEEPEAETTVTTAKEALPRPILPSAHGRISADRKTKAMNQDDDSIA